MRRLPPLHILHGECLLKFVHHLVTFKAKHDEVGHPVSVDVIRKLVVASWAGGAVSNYVRDICDADGVICNGDEEGLVALWVLAEPSTLRPQLARGVEGNWLSRIRH